MGWTKLRCAAVAATTAVFAVAGAVSIGASASEANTAAKGGQATIRMSADFKKKQLFFTGPRKVKEGAKLTILNTTDPKKVGPHTFTLVKESRVPNTKKQVNDCGRLLSAVCARVVKAHKVNLKTGQVKKPIVDPGEKGWDTSFGKLGDSSVLETKGAENTRRVTAEAGTNLYYICLVHPFMQGKIKVVR